MRRRAEEGPDASGNSSVSSKTNSNQKTVSHEAVLNGPLAQRRSFSIGKKKEAPEIKGVNHKYFVIPNNIKHVGCQSVKSILCSIEKDRIKKKMYYCV